MSPTSIRLRCPDCGRGLPPAPLFRYATDVRRRSCPRCGQRWSLVLRPMVARWWGVATEVTWTRMGVAHETT